MAVGLGPTAIRPDEPRCGLAAEGLDAELALGLGEVGGDELAAHPVEPFAEPVEVTFLGDDEQGGGALSDLTADLLQVLLPDADLLGRLAQPADGGTDRTAEHGHQE